MTASNSNPELIAFALNMWANFIETDNVALSARDAQQSGQPYSALSADQMRLVIRLRDLATEHQRSVFAPPPVNVIAQPPVVNLAAPSRSLPR